MALVVLNSGREPLGQFDCLDTQLTSFKGGEVCTWGHVSTAAGTDLAAADVLQDGYIPGSAATRPVVTLTLTSTSAPLFLSDDGITHYGTIFGVVIGGTAGMGAAGASLGPSTATGSGKMTLWDKQGLYGVTLDAADTAADGLIVANTSLAVGTKLTYTALGLLTPNRSTNSIAGTGSDSPTVGYLASFETNGSLVTTPNTLVQSLNSPSGSVSSVQKQAMYMAVFNYVGC